VGIFPLRQLINIKNGKCQKNAVSGDDLGIVKKTEEDQTIDPPLLIF